MTNLIEKEFKKLSRDEPTIGLLMMVKNEEKRIHVSLQSVLGFVNAIIIYDTGSTDRTLEIIIDFAEKNKINYYILKGSFVDFSTSRNMSLDYADTKDVHFLLLLDCNDELRGGEELKNLARVAIGDKVSAFLLCQEWKSGNIDKYYNIRFIKARKNWRYQGSVHEWMDSKTDPSPPYRYADKIVIFQDRTQDDDKSQKRFNRDRDLLLQDYRKNPSEPRTLFYLAQTCSCLGLNDEAMYYAKLRLEQTGFVEEVFHSYLRCGNCAISLNHSWHDALIWYIKAYEHSSRAEPLISIAEHYIKEKKWHLGYMYVKEACRLKYPEECVLFVDRGIYDYRRWIVMGVIASHVGELKEGKEACLLAQKADDTEEVRDLLRFYENIEKEGRKVPKTKEEKVTKSKFLDSTIKELKVKYPGLPGKQIVNRAHKLWKERT